MPYVLGALLVVPMLFLHSAACQMHVTAVERLWRRNPTAQSEYVWSYAYCKAVGWPARAVFGA